MSEETNPTKKNARVFKPGERAEAEAAGEIITTPFPSECLPKVLRDMAEGVAKLERLPVAMSGPMVLGVASAALGRGVILKGLRDKLTPPNLYVCVCKESGTGGSSAFGSITAPLDGMQASILRRFREEELPSLEEEKETLTIEGDKCKKIIKSEEAGDARNKAREKLKAIFAKQKKIEEAMRSPLLWTSDSTPESMAERLESNADTLAQIDSDAGAALNTMLGGYRDKSSRSGSQDIWLKAYSNEPVTITRQRGTIYLKRPCVAMLLVVTPSTARKHLEDKTLLESGFLGRLLLCDPKAVMNEGTFEEALAASSLPSGVSQPYEAAIWKALSLYRRPRDFGFSAENGDVEDGSPPDGEEGEPFVIKCEEEALRVIHEDRVRQCAAWNDAENDRELIARETEQALRIAIVLHIFDAMTFRQSGQGGTWKTHSCKGHEKKLSGETMRKAVMIRDWFKASLAAMLSPMKGAALDEAFARLKMMFDKNGWNHSGITPRHIQTHRIGGAHRKADTARQLLERWASEGKLTKRDREGKGTGRKPEPSYFLTGWGKQKD